MAFNVLVATKINPHLLHAENFPDLSSQPYFNLLKAEENKGKKKYTYIYIFQLTSGCLKERKWQVIILCIFPNVV